MQLVQLAGAVALAATVATTAWAQDVHLLSTKITGVAVYADRAQVTRTGRLELPASQAQIAVEGLPGWIDKESVRVSLEGAGDMRIIDVSIERTHLAKTTEEAVREADAKVQEVADAVAALQDERKVVHAELAQVESVRAFSVQKLPHTMATRPVKMRTFGETIDFVTERSRRAREALRGLDRKIRDLQPELSALSRARDELRARAKLQQTRVVVTVEGGRRGKLHVRYLTPGAAWEPVADLRTIKAKTATLVQYASVVQTTGEDWSGAELSFSTQRPAEQLRVPAAQALLLGNEGPGLSEVLGRMGESFNRAASAYQAVNRIVAQKNADWSANIARQTALQARARQAFQSLSTRGTTAHFTAISPRTVRADGNPVRVPIAVAKFDVTANLVAVPEVSLNAVRTAVLVNSTDQPILPGKVSLFVDGAFVGASQLDFVAPGERFTTFMGVHDRVKLGRTLDRKASSFERNDDRTTLKVSFLITAENLSNKPITLDLTDRVPVAQLEDIEIEDLVVPKGARRDANGLTRWQAVIPPGHKGSWRIGYTLEYPNDLAQRQAENSKRTSAPAAAPARLLMKDIEQLEDSLR